MIPFFDYRPEYRRHAAELEDAARRVLGSGSLILGPEVEAFEREFLHQGDRLRTIDETLDAAWAVLAPFADRELKRISPDTIERFRSPPGT